MVEVDNGEDSIMMKAFENDDSLSKSKLFGYVSSYKLIAKTCYSLDANNFWWMDTRSRPEINHIPICQ